jgi:hypothetical protein
MLRRLWCGATVVGNAAHRLISWSSICGRAVPNKHLPKSLLVGGTPQNVLDWGTLFAALMGTTAPFAWWLNTLILLVIAFGFALGSERLLHKFHRGMVKTWQGTLHACKVRAPRA